MTTWIDPTFGEALTTAGLVALARIVEADVRGARVELARVFAGQARTGEAVTVRRSAVVGRGHEGSVLPRGETFAFVVRGARGGGAEYEAFTDSYWAFPVSDASRVHMPVRDPFTRAYVLFDDLAALARASRDRAHSPAELLSRQCARLAQTPVAATQPVEVNDQLLALESLALLGSPAYAPSARPFLGSPHFQIRWSAVRAVATCGGPDAARTLLDLLAREDAPPVQAALAEALSVLADASMRDALEAALPRMFGSTMAYSRNITSPIMNMMPCPRDVLGAAIAKLSAPANEAGPDAATHAAPLRSLASARGLLALCESSPSGSAPLLDDGKLIVLTKPENAGALEKTCATVSATRKLTLQRIEDGVGIFAHLPDAVTSVGLDPGTPSEETFSGARLASLRDMARAVAVCRLVENPGAYDTASFRRIMREHRRFVVPLQPMTTAPAGSLVTVLTAQLTDGRVVPYEILRHQRADGLHYAVVFSWEDCAEAFFTALGNRTPTTVVDGETLFREVRRVEETYGVTSIVFDMEGPTKQSWLKVGAWRLVID